MRSVSLRELQHAQSFNLDGETAGDVMRAAGAFLDTTDATFLGFNLEYLPDTRFARTEEVVVPDSYRWVGVLTLEDA